jgi:hypothetical protein
MASTHEQRPNPAELTEQRMILLAKVYERSDADPEKDILYDNLLNDLNMDEDAYRKARLYLEDQGWIVTTRPPTPAVYINLTGQNQKNPTPTMPGSSAILRITRKGIVRAEAEHRSKREPPNS